MGVSEKGGKLGEWTGVLGAAGGAKMLAALITYPHEVSPFALAWERRSQTLSFFSSQVLRTRLRQPALAGGVRKYFGLVQTLKLVVAEEGVQALYGGLTPHLMRVVPNAAAMYRFVRPLPTRPEDGRRRSSSDGLLACVSISVYELAVRW